MPFPQPYGPALSEPAAGTILSNGTFAVYSNNDTPTIANNGTIALSSGGGAQAGQVLVTTAAAITGVILEAGKVDGQECTVVNVSANSITFAAVGTSNVADGVSDVIPALCARTFTWSTSQSKWYRLG